MILFVTGTGTGVGKTMVSRTLAEMLHVFGWGAGAIKPIETGCNPDAQDAAVLAAAVKQPHLTAVPGFYRAKRPVAPLAATMAGETAPDFAAITDACHTLTSEYEPLIVEGAGGLLVPLDETRTMADLAVALAAKVVIVAPDRLGVLSEAAATYEAAIRRGLEVGALVLNRGAAPPDESREHNLPILQRLGVPVIVFERADASSSAALEDAWPFELARALGYYL